MARIVAQREERARIDVVAVRLLLLAALSSFCTGCAGCTAYEYEEDVFLDVDGSGRMRVSGSREILRALHGEHGGSASRLGAHFDRAGFELTSARETERDGRPFLHVEGRFAAWETLCRHPAFENRVCRLAGEDETLGLELRVPAPEGRIPKGVPADGVVGFRFHLSSTVREHSSPEPVQRGNILVWERSAADHFGGTPVDVRIRFDRRSVLATTARILALSLGAVVAAVATAIGFMVRKGRRQLRDEPRTASGSRTR